MATNTQNPTFPSFVFSKKTMEEHFSDFRGAVLDFIQEYGSREGKQKLAEALINEKNAKFTDNLADSYVKGMMSYARGEVTGAEKAMIDREADRIMKSIDNIRQNSASLFKQAREQANAAKYATKAAKVAGPLGTAFTLTDLYSAHQKGVETGDYSDLGRTVAEIFGGVVGAELGAALAAFIASMAGMASLPFVAVAAVVVITAWIVSDRFGEWFGDWIGDKFNDWFGLNRTGLFHIYDPLVLDLDGDGIELVNANGWNGVQFDYNGNGIQTATQWVKPDDGLLVWDRNNNGVIDDGSELFGEDTPTKYGDPVTDGFSALRTVESHPDGEINAKDREWKNLKVWRDLNQDGETQKGELFTLDELGITALSLSAKNGVSTFTYANGAKNKLADVNFNRDTVHSEYKEHIALTEEQLKLPNLHGVGMLRDLREAANSEFFAQYTTAFQAA